jgi:hypothetical protein
MLDSAKVLDQEGGGIRKEVNLFGQEVTRGDGILLYCKAGYFRINGLLRDGYIW